MSGNIYDVSNAVCHENLHILSSVSQMMEKVSGKQRRDDLADNTKPEDR